jgi:hypothetical protein
VTSAAEHIEALRVRAGMRAEYERLAALHYRAAAPATVDLVLAAEEPGAGAVGVLVVSRPVLNARWRERAWPGRYSTGDKRRDAARLNAEVRAISRVVVDPRFRALGVARRLVRAYLDAPLTARTEAAAAMGAVCPFFRAAGMREWRLGPTARDARLKRAMRGAGVRAMELLTTRGARRVGDALRVWADASRATRAMKQAPAREIGRIAAGALLSPVVAYTWEVSGERRMANGWRATERRGDAGT